MNKSTKGERMNSIRIYVDKASGNVHGQTTRMYLTHEGDLSGNVEHAAEFWDIQFNAVVAERDILQHYETLVRAEIVEVGGAK